MTRLLPKPLCFAILLVGVPTLADADTGDVFNISVGQSGEYDNNLFRTPAGNTPQSEREDYISATSLVLDGNKQIGRQTLAANLKTSIVHFARDSQLDYRGQDYNASWLSGFGTDSYTRLQYTRSRTLPNFADQPGSLHNVVTYDGMSLDLGVRVAGNWQGVGLLANNRARNSDQTQQSGDNTSRVVEAGLRYAPTSGNYVDFRDSFNKTDYPNEAASFIDDNSFKQNELRLSTAWAPTDVGTIDARLSRIQRRHDHLTDRNFDAWTWSVGYDWHPTGASDIYLRAYRDVGTISDFSALYAATQGLSLQHTWLPTAKMKVVTFGNLNWRRYTGDSSGSLLALAAAILPPGASESDIATEAALLAQDKRRERVKTLGLNLTYNPTNKLQLQLGWNTETRRSNFSEVEYRDQTVNLSAQYTY